MKKTKLNLSQDTMPERLSPNAGPSFKLPPQAIEAEVCLLGALMLDRAAIAKVADFLLARDFYKPTHQAIYQAILELFEKNEPIDLLTVSSRLSEKEMLEEIGGNGYLTELINSVPTASHVINYARIVQKKRILRDLISASQEIGSLGYNEMEEIDVLLDQAEKRIFGIAQQSLSQEFVPVKDMLEEAFERIERLSKQQAGLRGLPTGFREVDNILAGLQKSDLILLASRPSMGKSALAMNIAASVAIKQKVPVGIFSLEMSKNQVVDRLIASQAGVDMWRLGTGRLTKEGADNDFAKIQRAFGILSQAPIFIDDAVSSNTLQMRAMARRLQMKEGLGLVVIDYLQLMETRGPVESIVRQITEISRSLKGLARELNIPVLAVSQLSRAVERRSPSIPKLADLRESGCLVGDTLITRADTGKRLLIKNLVAKKNIPVHSLGEDWKLTEMKISKVFCSGKKMVYELKTQSGFKIKASLNHPFRKLEGWCRLNELKLGDQIAVAKKLSLSHSQNALKPEESILLAHLLGDGCVLRKQPIHYTSGDWANIEAVARAAKKLFRINPRIVKQKNWWHLYLPSPYRLARGRHHPIINWYKDLEIEPVPSFEKEIPKKVFGLAKDSLTLFLRHLWATDGSIGLKSSPKRRLGVQIYYSTTSQKMAEGIKHLLLRFGIRSKISVTRKGDYRSCYWILIQGKENQLEFLEKIGSYGQKAKIVPQLIENLKGVESNPNVEIIPRESWWLLVDPARKDRELSWREFSQGIDTSYCGSALFKTGIGLARMERIASFLGDPSLFQLAQSDVFWDRVVSIKKMGVEKVYDATVPGTHNFLANDIVVHNSLEQDADVVLFIYREDRYNLNTDRKNIADIIIAKHRNGPVGKAELYFDDRIVTFRNLETRYEE